MSKQIQTFQFESQLIPTVIENGEVYFAVNELAQVLGFSNPRQAITSHVDKDDVQKLDTTTEYGNRRKNFVNESGMYALVFGSSNPEAKRFKKWVTSEVLPSIRKTGKYRLQPAEHIIPQTLPEALRLVADMVEKNQFLTQQIEQQAPLVELAERCIFSGENMCLQDVAQIIDISPKIFNQILCEHQFTYRTPSGKLRAYQKAINKGLMKTKLYPRRNSQGKQYASPQPLITPKGLQEILRIFPQSSIF